MENKTKAEKMRSSNVVAVILIMAFLTLMTYHLLLFSLSLLKESMAIEMHLTYAEVGFIFSVTIIALIILRIPWGMLIDRIGIRIPGGVSLTLLGVFGILRGFAIDYETLLLFQLFLGACFAAIVPCLPKLVASWFPSEKAGFATGVSLSGFAIGDMIALGVTPYMLMLWNSWRIVTLIFGVWTLIVAATWWVLVQEPEGQMNPNANHDPDLKVYANLIKMKMLWLLTGLYFCAGACYDTMLIWLPSFLQAKGFTETDSGLLTTMLPLGFLSASFGVGVASDKIGGRKSYILLLGFVAGPAIYAAGTLPTDTVWFTAFIVGLCTIGVLSLVLTIPTELVQMSTCVASATGLITSIGNIGSLIMPTLVGQLRDMTCSFNYSVLALAILGEFMLLLGVPLVESRRKAS